VAPNRTHEDRAQRPGDGEGEDAPDGDQMVTRWGEVGEEEAGGEFAEEDG
jgi:hypothetical protein